MIVAIDGYASVLRYLYAEARGGSFLALHRACVGAEGVGCSGIDCQGMKRVDLVV